MPIKRRLLLLLLPILILSAVATILWRQQIDLRARTPLIAELGFFRDDWQPTVQVTDQAALRLLGSAFEQASTIPAAPQNGEAPFYRLRMQYVDGAAEYLIAHDLRVVTATEDSEIVLGATALQELAQRVALLKRLQFGELLPWSEVSQLIPRYSTFSITDLETGLTWRAQRRAGSQHADVQPLSKADTATLKTVYAGSWSWNRRAVIVEYAGRRIAASVNGMPHGSGALPNGFPGHHCLHFLGSTTHGGDNLDPVHQLMVHRAAGELCEYLDQAAPEELQILALEMAGQGEKAIVSLLTNNQAVSSAGLVDQIRDIRIWSQRISPASGGTLRGNYNVSVYFSGDAREYRLNVTLTCRYHGYLGKWLVEPDYLQQLLSARG